MHIAGMDLGSLGANAIVAGGVPAVAGAGLAAKRRNTGAVSVAFFGDGALQQGVVYESLNIAALWKLPVAFACVNNQYGMATRIDRASARIDFETRRTVRASECARQRRRCRGRRGKSQLIDTARRGEPGFLIIDTGFNSANHTLDNDAHAGPERARFNSPGQGTLEKTTSRKTTPPSPRNSGP